MANDVLKINPYKYIVMRLFPLEKWGRELISGDGARAGTVVGILINF